MGWGESGFSSWGFRGPTLVLFLLYLNVTRMHQQFRFSSQPLTILAPWVLHIGGSIPLVPPWVTASHFLAGNREAELKPTAFSSLPSISVLSLPLPPSLLFYISLSPYLSQFFSYRSFSLSSSQFVL